MEIGSEFWLEDTWVNDDPAGQIGQTGEIKWLNKFGNIVLTLSGRDAIFLLLQEIKPRVKTVLLPAYICDSVIMPFVRRGYHCCFYDINEDLSPILDTININEEIGIFFHLGYYGFQTNQNLSEVIQTLKKKSVIIVEDITHTLFSDTPRIVENDYYIASIRKWMGLPGGGLLASPAKEIKSIQKQNELFTSIRKEALILKANYIYSENKSLKKQYQKLFLKAETILSNDAAPSKIDRLSMNIINATNANQLIKCRMTNFRTLVEGVSDFGFLKPVFKELPEQVCPMFCPVYILKKRNEFQELLSRQQIYCPVHWNIPKQILINQWNHASNIYQRILSIPCDQRYNTNDMSQVISVIQKIGSSI